MTRTQKPSWCHILLYTVIEELEHRSYSPMFPSTHHHICVRSDSSPTPDINPLPGIGIIAKSICSVVLVTTSDSEGGIIIGIAIPVIPSGSISGTAAGMLFIHSNPGASHSVEFKGVAKSNGNSADTTIHQLFIFTFTYLAAD